MFSQPLKLVYTNCNHGVVAQSLADFAGTLSIGVHLLQTACRTGTLHKHPSAGKQTLLKGRAASNLHTTDEQKTKLLSKPLWAEHIYTWERDPMTLNVWKSSLILEVPISAAAVLHQMKRLERTESRQRCLLKQTTTIKVSPENLYQKSGNESFISPSSSASHRQHGTPKAVAQS